jgi:hypothetical protein
LNIRRAIRPALAPIIAAGLQNNGTGPVRHGPVQASQHPFRGVAVNAGVHDMDVGSFRPQYRFELRRISLIPRHSLAVGVARAKGDDGCGISRCNANIQQCK